MVKHEGQWGTVCDDDFGKTEAQIACRTLGFQNGPHIYTQFDSNFTESNIPILMDDVDCANGASDFLQCSHSGWGDEDCSHSEDILLTCEHQEKRY